MAKITLSFIAETLGISVATASKALKDYPDISAKTKKEVKDLAAELKYKPNSFAQSLRNQESKIIGLIIPEIVHYFFSSVISGIEDVAYDAGFNVIICQSNEKYEREVANTKTLLASRVDGVLVSISKETDNYDHFYNLRNNHIPMVFYAFNR